MFNPSEKQLLALANMEKFNWIGSNRIYFDTYNEFQDYFDLLSKKSKKKSKLLDNMKEGKISQKDINEKIKAKKDTFYWNEWVLRWYAIDYINRYSPSKNQLKDQLIKKTKNREVVNKVFQDVEKYINEELMVNALVEQLKQRWKNLSFISQKLYNKKYDWELIKNTINEIKTGWSLLQEYTLEEKIKYYQNKGLSRNAIYMKFYERWEDKEVLNGFLDKYFNKDQESESLTKIIADFKEKGLDNKKIIGRLLTKGFKYADIKDNL